MNFYKRPGRQSIKEHRALCRDNTSILLHNIIELLYSIEDIELQSQQFLTKDN